MGEYRSQYDHETDGKSLEYRPPGRHFYEQKAAEEQAAAKNAAAYKEAGAKHRANLAKAGREYEAKKARSRSR